MSGKQTWHLVAVQKHVQVTKELEDICLKSAKIFKGEIVGVDLMESNDNGYWFMR